MTREETIELKAAVGRLMYSNNKDVRDYNALIDFIESALRPVSREQVEKGRWIFRPYKKMPWCTQAICSECGSVVENNSSLSQESGIKLLAESNPFCRRCGAPMTDEAVEMVMERMEALYASDTEAL